MPDIVKIFYNGQDAFASQPTPFVALDYNTIYAGERWAQQENMTIQGQITGCSFHKLISGQRTLVNNFNKSFQTLEIFQQTGAILNSVYKKDLVEVRSINFASNQMIGVIPYTINLTCYPSGLFSGAFGVLEPSDDWSFQENQDATLAATHTISCRGYNTSNGDNNALTNARNWAFGRTGIASAITPIFINGSNPDDFCLLTLNENIDRFNGTYTLTENYTNDLARSGYGVLRYTTSIESGNNLITVSLNGSVEGCNKNISGARAAFSRLDKVATAAVSYNYTFNRTDLNPIPLTQSFNEDPFLARIDFSYTFNNDNTPEISFDYTVALSVGVNGAITANIAGTIRARGGTLASKLNRTQAYANTINLYNLVLPYYNNFDASSIATLNPVATSNGRSINQSDGTVQLNATYTNQEKVSDALDKFDFTLVFNKAVVKVDSKAILNGLGSYSLVNLGYSNRASLSINGTAVVSIDYTSAQGISAVKQKCLSLLAQYGRFGYIALDENDVVTNRYDNRLLSFTFTWSFDGTSSGPSSIGTLAI